MKKILLGLIATLFIVQVILANSLASGGKQMKELLAEKERLNFQLADLENQINVASSLDVIRVEAGKMGMKTAPLKYLPPAPVALVPQP